MSDRLAEARRATWAATLARTLLVLGLWGTLVSSRLMDPGLTIIRTGVPLAYVVAELLGLALVLNHLARLARAATRY